MKRKKIYSDRFLEDKMEITVRENGNICIINLEGRLDLASGTALKDRVKEMFDKNINSIHLNLENVEFINSSGLGALVSLMKEARIRKGRLTLSNLASYVQEIFEITQLSHIFELFTTEEEALNSYDSVSVL